MATEKFQAPMTPWSDIQQFAKSTMLKRTNFNLFYFEAGGNHSDNIILVHGLGDEADTWRHIIKPLAKAYHIIAIDLPGFGRSDKPKRKYTPEFFINVIQDLMETLSIYKAYLMGSSLGGILCQGFSIQNPEKVFGLILVGGALLQHEAMADWSIKLMRIPLLGEWLYTRLRKNPDAAYDSLRNVYHDLDGMPKEDRDFLYLRVNKRVWSDRQRRAYFSTLRNLTSWVEKSQEALRSKLKKLHIPTLIIRGEYDQLFPELNADAIIKSQEKAAKVTINDAGHLPHQEASQAFIKPVLVWLEDQKRYNFK